VRLSSSAVWLASVFAPVAWAQDPFEIHIYEYEPMALGEYSLETHLNFNAQGTRQPDGTLLPTDHQTHLTLEPTAGISPNFAIGNAAGGAQAASSSGATEPAR